MKNVQKVEVSWKESNDGINTTQKPRHKLEEAT